MDVRRGRLRTPPFTPFLHTQRLRLGRFRALERAGALLFATDHHRLHYHHLASSAAVIVEMALRSHPV